MDLLTVKDAVSMASGYQEAMEQSDAKYKIYMHQDVFILNRNFLADVLAVFEDDPEIGMIGMVGYEKMSVDGIMWHQKRIEDSSLRRVYLCGSGGRIFAGNTIRSSVECGGSHRV